MTIWQSDKFRRSVIWVIAPLLVYTVIALIMTWPLATHLESQVAGVSYGDTYMMLRQAWDAREAIRAGQNPLEQTRIAYPMDFTSYMMWATPLRWLPVALLSLVITPVAAFNLWLIATLILNGTTAYWLGMELADRKVWAALLSGLVFMAFPAMQGHLAVAHVDVLAMYGLPLFALYAWRVLYRGAGWRAVGWGGLWAAVACLGLPSQIVYNLMPVVLFLGLYHLLWDRARLGVRGAPLRDQPWIKFAAMIALSGVILLIFFGPLMTSTGQAEINRLSETGRVTYSADALAFVSPSIFGPLHDRGLVPDYARAVLGTNSIEGFAYLGVVASLLVLVGLVRCRAARPWLVVAVDAAVFSLGPLLKWHDKPVVLHIEALETYITLPWALLEDLPVFETTRTPGRFNGATALAWGALVSIGAGWLAREKPSRRNLMLQELVPGAVAVVLATLILLEYTLFHPYPTLDAVQPDYFRDLAERDDVRAVLNLPVDNSLAQMRAMGQQIVHGKPMIAGALYRRTPQDPAVLAVLDRALLGGSDGALPPVPAEDVVPGLLDAVGADRVVLHKDYVPDAVASVDRLRALLGAPDFENDQIAVFASPPAPSDKPENLLIFAPESGAWIDAPPLGDGSGAWLGTAGAWYLYAPAPFYGELVMPVRSYAIPRQVIVELDDQIIGAWTVEQGELRLPLWVEAGFHSVRFTARAGCTAYPFTLTCLAGSDCAPVDPPYCLSVELGMPAWLPVDATPVVVDVALDYGMRLHAYDLRAAEVRAGGEVRLRLFWSAEQALPAPYALFAHVSDPATGRPLAQYDGFPLLPVDEWPTNTHWIADIVITLPDDLPPGTYAVNVGWFDPVSNTRLAVSGDDVWATEGIVSLGTVDIPAHD